MVPCSGLHAHRPARSHSSAQPRPPVHRTRRRPHRGARVTAVTGTRGRHATQGHTHAGRQGAVGVHGGLQDAQRGVPRKRKRWRSQTQTGVSWHHDFRHKTPQRTSEPSVTGLLDTQPLSNDTHSLRRNSWTRKPWDTHPFGHTNLSGTEPSNTPLRFTPLGHVPFGHTNPGRIASSNSQSEGCKPLRHSSPAHSSTLGPSDSSQPTDAIHRTLYRPRPDVRRTCSTWTLPH